MFTVCPVLASPSSRSRNSGTPRTQSASSGSSSPSCRLPDQTATAFASLSSRVAGLYILRATTQGISVQPLQTATRDHCLAIHPSRV
eukprot:59385-Pleurochrysis_carterae.AAC.2